MTTAERIARERDFHNQRFVENNVSRESPTRRFYDAISYGFEVPQRDAWSDGDRTALCWARTNE